MENWMHRAAAFELLSLAFLPPSREVAEALVAGEFADACSEALGGLGIDAPSRSETLGPLSEYERRDADAVYHELRCEHMHLFVGEREAAVTPYVGVWAAQQRGQQGLLFVGKESVAIEHFMRDHGAVKNLAAGQSNDPMDHVGTICEFLKYLCLVNAKAVQAPEGIVVAENDYDEFVQCHFIDYVIWCSSRVHELARIPFYESMALMLAAVCAAQPVGRGV